MEDRPEPDGAVPTAAEQACFEAGIKFGSLYHQFAGTPVSPDSADSLAAAMAEAIENQPHCRDVSVDVDTDALAEDIGSGSASYTELTGRFLDVEIQVESGGCTVVAELVMEDGYPLMTISSIDRPNR
jgi:hypothetical protein